MTDHNPRQISYTSGRKGYEPVTVSPVTGIGAYETGTLLVFDETHSISSGYGGHGCTHGPMADLMVVGKSIGGGVPSLFGPGS